MSSGKATNDKAQDRPAKRNISWNCSIQSFRSSSTSSTAVEEEVFEATELDIGFTMNRPKNTVHLNNDKDACMQPRGQQDKKLVSTNNTTHENKNARARRASSNSNGALLKSSFSPGELISSKLAMMKYKQESYNSGPAADGDANNDTPKQNSMTEDGSWDFSGTFDYFDDDHDKSKEPRPTRRSSFESSFEDLVTLVELEGADNSSTRSSDNCSPSFRNLEGCVCGTGDATEVKNPIDETDADICKTNTAPAKNDNAETTNKTAVKNVDSIEASSRTVSSNETKPTWNKSPKEVDSSTQGNFEELLVKTLVISSNISPKGSKKEKRTSTWDDWAFDGENITEKEQGEDVPIKKKSSAFYVPLTQHKIRESKNPKHSRRRSRRRFTVDGDRLSTSCKNPSKKESSNDGATISLIKSLNQMRRSSTSVPVSTIRRE